MEILVEKKPKLTFVCSRFFASPMNIVDYRPMTDIEKKKFAEFSDVFHDEFYSDVAVRKYVEDHNVGEYCILQKQGNYILQSFACLDDDSPVVHGFQKMYYGGKAVVLADEGTKAELQRSLFDAAVKLVSSFGMDSEKIDVLIQHFTKIPQEENLYKGETWIVCPDKVVDFIEGSLSKMKKGL